MAELSDVIPALRTAGGFLLVAHGQSGDLGNSVQNNYNVAHENLRYSSIDSGVLPIDRDIYSYINTKILYESPRTPEESNLFLYGNLKKAGIGTVPVTRAFRRKVSRSGFWGSVLDSIFGYQTKVEQRPEFQQVIRYEKSATLDTYLQSGQPSNAYFIAHYLRLETPLQDNSNQKDCPAPILYVLGDKTTIQKTVEYLKHKPAQYGAFMKALIPADRFPITNRLILDQVQTPELVFLNVDKITERIREEDLESICQRWGEK